MATGRKTGGRAKGTRNKRTVAFADALKLAYQRIGGDRAFVKWCRANPDIFYNGLMAKLLPHELNIQAELEVTRDPMTDFDVARRIAFILARAGQQLPALEAERVETLPSPETVQEIPSNPIKISTYSIPPEPFHPPDDISPTLETYPGSQAEQGATNVFSQRPRLKSRPVIRRRRDLV